MGDHSKNKNKNLMSTTIIKEKNCIEQPSTTTRLQISGLRQSHKECGSV